MKKTIVLSCLIVVCSFLLAGFITNADKSNTANARTEEYAIVDAFDYGKKKVIRVTIGEEPAEEKEWVKEKTEIYGDFTPVMKELHALNEKGFEIVSSSLAYVPLSSASGSTMGTSTPRTTFLFKKKLQ